MGLKIDLMFIEFQLSKKSAEISVMPFTMKMGILFKKRSDFWFSHEIGFRCHGMKVVARKIILHHGKMQQQ